MKKRKALVCVRLELTTFALSARRSTDWANRPAAQNILPLRFSLTQLVCPWLTRSHLEFSQFGSELHYSGITVRGRQRITCSWFLSNFANSQWHIELHFMISSLERKLILSVCFSYLSFFLHILQVWRLWLVWYFGRSFQHCPRVVHGGLEIMELLPCPSNR